jgi:hypothetical protein
MNKDNEKDKIRWVTINQPLVTDIKVGDEYLKDFWKSFTLSKEKQKAYEKMIQSKKK